MEGGEEWGAKWGDGGGGGRGVVFGDLLINFFSYVDCQTGIWRLHYEVCRYEPDGCKYPFVITK